MLFVSVIPVAIVVQQHTLCLFHSAQYIQQRHRKQHQPKQCKQFEQRQIRCRQEQGEAHSTQQQQKTQRKNTNYNFDVCNFAVGALKETEIQQTSIRNILSDSAVVCLLLFNRNVVSDVCVCVRACGYYIIHGFEVKCANPTNMLAILAGNCLLVLINPYVIDASIRAIMCRSIMAVPFPDRYFSFYDLSYCIPTGC